MSLVGAEVRRKEDPNLLCGRGMFVDDFAPARTAYMAFATSPLAHGRIEGVDVVDATAVEGVLAVWTAADIADLPTPPGLPDLERPLLAGQKVRFAGEAVAVVVAESRAAAADAAAAVIADIEPLPAAASIEAALAEDAAQIDPSVAGNVAFALPAENPEVDQALGEAPPPRHAAGREQPLCPQPAGAERVARRLGSRRVDRLGDPSDPAPAAHHPGDVLRTLPGRGQGHRPEVRRRRSAPRSTTSPSSSSPRR